MAQGRSMIEKLGLQDKAIELYNAEGNISRVSDRLSEEAGRRISVGMVSRFMREYGRLKNEVIKEVVKERIGEALPSVADILKGDVNELMNMLYKPDNDLNDKLSIYAEIRKHAEVMLKYFGLGESLENKIIDISIDGYSENE